MDIHPSRFRGRERSVLRPDLNPRQPCNNSIVRKKLNKIKLQPKKKMSNYHKLYTPQDSAVVFIDHQPQMTFGVASIDRASLINNVTLLAKVAKELGVPAVLTAVETETFSG